MLIYLEDLEQARWDLWKKKKIVGFTSGCFDILHFGHLHVLQEAKKHCDVLIVAVNTNDSVRQLKGIYRPINDATDRAALIAGLKPVDYVIYNPGLNNNLLIKMLKPDVYVKSGEYETTSTSAEIITEQGGKNVFIPVLPGYSSSKIMEKIKKC